MDWTWKTLDIVLRLGAATSEGMIVGLNRDLTNKPIGMRTLALVALGAAVVTLSAIQFGELALYPDPLGRVVQGGYPRNHGGG